MIRREIGQAATPTATAVSARTERKPSGGLRRSESPRDEPAAVGKAEDDGRRAPTDVVGPAPGVLRRRRRERLAERGDPLARRREEGEPGIRPRAPAREDGPLLRGRGGRGRQQLARDLGGELEAALERLPSVAEVPGEAAEKGDHPDAREDGEVDPRVEPEPGVPPLPPHASWLLAKT